MLKVDVDHKNFRGKVLCSAGLGKGYTVRANAQNHKYKKGETNEKYRTRTGIKLNLPIYYRNKLFTEQEYRDWETDRKSTRLNSSHRSLSRMPSSA